MRVLVACEFSGIVRDAFRARGHDAVSCDLLPSERPGPHIQGDILKLLTTDYDWDLMIAHPSCTHTAVSGARWFKGKRDEQERAIRFFRNLWTWQPDHIKARALEHPISVISTVVRKPDQIIQPWQFGEPETKATCLWLKNLPKLEATKIIPMNERKHSVWKEAPGPDRWKNRSRTFQGIADAMADQWGKVA